jgi:phosphohistidine phosphatase
MDLILWRHAEAEDGVPDMQRALTDKGRKQAEKMARWLRSHLPDDARILVSPALRTQQTASALTRDFSTLDTLAPGADAKSVLQAAGWPRAGGVVVVVGHQPTLGEVLAHVMADRNDSWSVKKGAIIWLTNRKHGNSAETVLKAVLPPDLL